MPEAPPWSTALKYPRVAMGAGGGGKVPDPQCRRWAAMLQTISLSHPVIKNSLPPNSFLGKNTRKFFPQANLSVQTRDREGTCLSALGWFDRISESLVKTCRGLLQKLVFASSTSCHLFRSLLAPLWENFPSLCPRESWSYLFRCWSCHRRYPGDGMK